MTVSAISL